MSDKLIGYKAIKGHCVSLLFLWECSIVINTHSQPNQSPTDLKSLTLALVSLFANSIIFVQRSQSFRCLNPFLCLRLPFSHWHIATAPTKNLLLINISINLLSLLTSYLEVVQAGRYLRVDKMAKTTKIFLHDIQQNLCKNLNNISTVLAVQYPLIKLCLKSATLSFLIVSLKCIHTKTVYLILLLSKTPSIIILISQTSQPIINCFIIRLRTLSFTATLLGGLGGKYFYAQSTRGTSPLAAVNFIQLLFICFHSFVFNVIIGKIMSQQSINSNADLSALLLFQDNFISTIHTHLYRKNCPFQEAFLTFQINHVSDIKDKFNNMVTTLSSQLIDLNLSYELSLRDSFQRLLKADYLPLLRINRYQLTKLSLYGFDIYVEPLEAVLQIYSRLEVSKKRVLQCNISLQSVGNAESALQRGWQVYMAYVQEWRMAFNLYVLQEYLRVGGKSFARKDREILFTGSSNLLNQLVPALSGRKNLKLLKELAQLNNSLYHFHQSFNYFQFYTLLLPLHTALQPIFAAAKEVAQKCLRTNILTPLLLGILRHRQSFLTFIAAADSPVWLPYLNAIISGIAINLKFRILQYEQIMDIFEKASNRAGLLGRIDTSYVFGKLQDEWRDAKEFFISATKVGFNSGEVQVWKSIEFAQIGPRVIASVIDGMLLNPQQNQELGELLGTVGQKLGEELLRVSEGKISVQMLGSSSCHLEKGIQSQQKLLSLLRILNLLGIENSLQEGEEYLLNLAISGILNINVESKPVIQLILAECLNKINSFLIDFKANSFSLLRNNVIALHTKFKPQSSHSQITRLYINNYDPKMCVSALLKILPIAQPTCRTQIIDQISQCFLSQRSANLVKLRTFQQELLVRSYLVHPSYQTHSVLIALICELTNLDNLDHSKVSADQISADPINKGKVKVDQMQTDHRRRSLLELIKELVSRNGWIAFCLLNFPVSRPNSICSFGSYLIQHTTHHKLLKSILTSSTRAVKSQQGIDLIQELTFPNLTENICRKVNETDQTEHMLPFLSLLLWTAQQMQQQQPLCRQILSVYLFAMQNATSHQTIRAIVSDISRVSVVAFGEKLQFWLGWLLVQRIQNKFETQRVSRKRVLRSQKNSVYFIMDEEVCQANSQKETYNVPNSQVKKEIAVDFWTLFDQLSKLNEEQLLSLLEKPNNHQQQFTQLLFPPIRTEILKDILQSTPQSRTLDLVVLNTDNYIAAIKHFIAHNKFAVLKTYKMIARLTSEINEWLKLQGDHKCHFLGAMSEQLSPKQWRRIAQGFYIEWACLQYYVRYMDGIEYLVIHNTTNWRMLQQYLNKQFSYFKLASLLLQYRQYLGITSHPNHQYESSIRTRSQQFARYIRLFSAKLNAILAQSTSEQQRELRLAHQLSSLNMLTVSVQLREIVAKLALLHREMRDRSIEIEKYWITDIADLNALLNQHVRGKVLLPDFTHGFMLTNDQLLHKYKVEIGIFLEQYYEIVGVHVKEGRYLPKQLRKVTVSELSREEMSIIGTASLQLPLSSCYDQVLAILSKSDCIITTADCWEINFENLVASNSHLNMFYRLGCLSALKQSEFSDVSVPQLLRSVITREKLSWQLIKPIRPELFHYIKSVLVEPEIASRQLCFAHEGEELTTEGRSIKVNDYNKVSYCQLMAVRAIGQPALLCVQHFFQGYTNQRSNI